MLQHALALSLKKSKYSTVPAPGGEAGAYPGGLNTPARGKLFQNVKAASCVTGPNANQPYCSGQCPRQ
jgi:hypothetical protein